MKYLLLAPFVLFSSFLQAADCVVVSGDKKDTNGAFGKRALLKPDTSMVAGKKCKVVGGLKELKTYMASGKVKAGSDLLIVFGAHGGKDGKGGVTFDFNTDEPTADEVTTYLQTLSKTYQVGAVLHACQSGEVMNKIITNENDPTAGKLCLVTSSSKGRMSFSNEKDLISQMEKVKPGKTLEDVFLATPSGMISSAAWEEVGVPQYLRAKSVGEKLNMGLEIMQDMDQMLRAPGVCTTPGERNSALCIAPAVTDELFRDLSRFMDPYIQAEDKSNLIATYTITSTIFAENGDKDGAACLKGIVTAYQKKFGQKLEELYRWDALDEFQAELKKAPFAPACEKYKKSQPPEEQARVYTGDMTKGLADYKKSLESLKRKYTKTNWTEEFDLGKFALASAGDKTVCKPQSKQQIIQSLLGESFFEEEIVRGEDGSEGAGEMETFESVDISTQYVMKAFQNASVQKKEMPNSRDAKRREACRKFKL